MSQRTSFFSVILLLTLILTITSIFVIHPAEILGASIHGIEIWWDVLFPALFPFLVISELMLGFGIVHFFGTLLDPLMRPLFRVPGSGGFVMAMGFAAGYPVGSRLTAQLREQELVTRTEGERLISFTTTSDPIFLIGAVSVGFFHQPEIALILMIAHYGGAVILGLIFRFFGRSQSQSIAEQNQSKQQNSSLLVQAFQAMHHSRIRNRDPIGQLLLTSVENALKLVLVIGGLVVFFSVLMECLHHLHLLQLLYFILNTLFEWLMIPEMLAVPFVNGLFEVTLGTKAAGELSSSVPLMLKCAAAAFVLSWGGLSVHAQIASLLNQTDMRMGPFIWARLIHGFISFFSVILLWPATKWMTVQGFVPAFQSFDSHDQIISRLYFCLHYGMIFFLLFLFLLLLLSFFLYLIHHIQRNFSTR